MDRKTTRGKGDFHMTLKCVKNGCNNPQETGKQLCTKHTAEWSKIWEKSRNKNWKEYIYGKFDIKEKVQFT